MKSIVKERVVDCPTCRGKGLVQSKPGCHWSRCFPCRGRGFFFLTMSRDRLGEPAAFGRAKEVRV
jgi:DnaJ-class molecular chaperone